MIYLMETNGNVYSWLVEFYKKNPIPRVSHQLMSVMSAGSHCMHCSSLGAS